jgi:hypothetical protein
MVSDKLGRQKTSRGGGGNHIAEDRRTGRQIWGDEGRQTNGETDNSWKVTDEKKDRGEDKQTY